jgi:preprotein translocase SecE subunit
MNKAANSIKTYLKSVRAEWGKITWPERGQVITETLFVVIIVFVFTVSIYFMDLIFKWALSFIPHN